MMIENRANKCNCGYSADPMYNTLKLDPRKSKRKVIATVSSLKKRINAFEENNIPRKKYSKAPVRMHTEYGSE